MRTVSTAIPARVILVEDEPHARRYLRTLLEEESRINVVGESANGAEGVQQIESLCPDIVFVYVQIPALDGFAMIDQIGVPTLPLFVFVTGHPEYAMRAFEVEAVDYLCKPFDEARLAAAVDRALRRLHATPRDGSTSRWLSRLPLTDDGQTVLVAVDEIIWIEAAGKHVVIHTAAGSHSLRETIQELEGLLDPRDFLRTHRSALVRKAAVRGLQAVSHGDYVVKLVNGAEAPLSRGLKASFFRAMMIPHRA